MPTPPPHAVIACRRCGAPIATSDGRRLHCGGAWFARPVTMRCGRCDAGWAWKPDSTNNAIDTAPRLCLADP